MGATVHSLRPEPLLLSQGAEIPDTESLTELDLPTVTPGCSLLCFHYHPTCVSQPLLNLVPRSQGPPNDLMAQHLLPLLKMWVLG